MNNTISIFTKPWKALSTEELGETIAKLGFTGIEFPLRDGFQAEPKTAERDLPILCEKLKAYGIAVASVASATDENIFAACAAAGVPVIRIMLLDPKGSYMEAEEGWKRQLAGLLPLCEKYGVKVAVQQHYGAGVFSTMDMRHVLEGFDPRYVGGIWDAAHSGLAGERPNKALDVAWEHLAMVNFKNAFWTRVNGPEGKAKYKPYFTTAEQGMCDWAEAVAFLRAKNYTGAICMPAEYTDEPNVLAYIARDLKYLKELLAD